jgi:2-methylisocitrate lyase-like PEP mutase family enzyme
MDILGQADAGLLTQTELVENVRRICDVTTIPLMVDCDTGYGDAPNVQRTVAAVLKAGASALFLEDQVTPKRCGFLVGKEVLPANEAVDKLRAAIATRDRVDADAVIMARCDARTAVGGSLAELISRLKAYKATGADVLMADGLTSWDEVAPIRAAVDGPLYIGPHFMRPPLTLAELEDAGICMVSYHVEPLAYMALWDFVSRVHEDGFNGGRDYLEGLSANHA